MRLSVLNTIGFLAGGPLVVQAETFPIFLSEALAANPQLTRDFQIFRAAAATGDKVGALPDPKITYTEFLESVQTRTGPQERVFGISQAFPWPGTLKLRRGAADAMAQAAHHRYEATRRRITIEVADAYFTHALVAESGRIAARQRDLLKDLTPVVEERVRGGASMANSLRIEIELRRSSDRAESFQRKLPATATALEATLGRTPGKNPVLPTAHLPRSPPALPPADKLQPGLSQHPLVLAAESGTSAAGISSELARLAARPSFMLGAKVIDIGDGGESPVAVTLGLSLPIWSGKNRAEKNAAEAELLASKASTEAVHQTLEVAFRMAYQTHLDARARLRLHDRDLLPPATEALELIREDYRNGKSSITDVLDAERVLLDLQLARATACATAHQALWKVRALVGDLPARITPTGTPK